MPVIKPRMRGKELVRLYARLERENHEVLYAYAAFLGESSEYILNQLVEHVLAKDKEFLLWRADHSQSYAPRSSAASSAVTNGRTPSAKRRLSGQATAAASASGVDANERREAR